MPDADPAPSPPERRPPGSDKNGAASPTLPLPPPRDVEDLDLVLAAIASTPADHRGEIVEWIDGLPDRDLVAELLHTELLAVPTADVSRSGLLLSMLGQLRSPASVDVLERFAWFEDADILPAPTHQDGAAGDDSMFGAGMLQARAAEMLVWIAGWDDRGARILTDHPLAGVRLATIDAIAFATGDDPAALDRLRDVVRDEDRWAIGMPRLVGGADDDGFSERVAAFQAQIDAAPDEPREDSESGPEEV